MCVKSEEGGPGDKKPLQYFEFGLQYLVQPLGVNPTYSTFNVDISKCGSVRIWFYESKELYYYIQLLLNSVMFFLCVPALWAQLWTVYHLQIQLL